MLCSSAKSCAGGSLLVFLHFQNMPNKTTEVDWVLFSLYRMSPLPPPELTDAQNHIQTNLKGSLFKAEKTSTIKIIWFTCRLRWCWCPNRFYFDLSYFVPESMHSHNCVKSPVGCFYFSSQPQSVSLCLCLTLNCLQRVPAARSHQGPPRPLQYASGSHCSIPWRTDKQSVLLCLVSASSPHTEHHLPRRSSSECVCVCVCVPH